MAVGEIIWILLPEQYHLWFLIPALVTIGVGMGTLFTSAQIAVVSNIN